MTLIRIWLRFNFIPRKLVDKNPNDVNDYIHLKHEETNIELRQKSGFQFRVEFFDRSFSNKVNLLKQFEQSNLREATPAKWLGQSDSSKATQAKQVKQSNLSKVTRAKQFEQSNSSKVTLLKLDSSKETTFN